MHETVKFISRKNIPYQGNSQKKGGKKTPSNKIIKADRSKSLHVSLVNFQTIFSFLRKKENWGGSACHIFYRMKNTHAEVFLSLQGDLMSPSRTSGTKMMIFKLTYNFYMGNAAAKTLGRKRSNASILIMGLPLPVCGTG